MLSISRLEQVSAQVVYSTGKAYPFVFVMFHTHMCDIIWKHTVLCKILEPPCEDSRLLHSFFNQA